jgi:hypothetical protein
MDFCANDYNDTPYKILTQREQLTLCDKLALWYFFHSTPNGLSSYNDFPNIYCSCLNFCPGNLELTCESNSYCKKNDGCFLICCSFLFI